MTREELSISLFEEGAVKFGSFTLKSGIVSPFYIDLRQVISCPRLLAEITDLLAAEVADLDFDVISGIPYAALPLASTLAYKLRKPLVFLRKEEKSYGMGGMLVGKRFPGARCIVVDDLITTGGSKMETARALEAEGFTVTRFLVLIDRSRNGAAEMEARGYTLGSVLRGDEMFRILACTGKITQEEEARAQAFLLETPGAERVAGSAANAGSAARSCVTAQVNPPPASAAGLTTGAVKEPLRERVRRIMNRKRSNLILSLDVQSAREFFTILEQTADSIVMVKTHIDILADFTPDFTAELVRFSAERELLILEDRKFADIGNTVRVQFTSGVYRIADWADGVTAHLISGESVIDGCTSESGKNPELFLLARMSSAGNLITPDYTAAVLETAKRRKDRVAGIIGHGNAAAEVAELRAALGPEPLILVPGVGFSRDTDSLGQTYLPAAEPIRGGADCVIAGRAVYRSADPRGAAERLREECWEVYLRAGERREQVHFLRRM